LTNVSTGSEILQDIMKLIETEEEIVLAVAYWGNGSLSLLNGLRGRKNVRIVLNVHHGGTNPLELEKLMAEFGSRLKVHETLHAKIYAGRSHAVIGSANASASGFSLSRNAHAEATVTLSGGDAGDVFKQAEAFYKAGHEVTANDLKICRERFGRTSLASALNEGSIGSKASALEVFCKRQDIFGRLPFVLTSGPAEIDPKEHWAEQRLENPEPGLPKEFDPEIWDYFDFILDKNYLDKTCVNMHLSPNEKIRLGLIRTSRKPIEHCSFVQKLNWTEVGNLGPYWTRKSRNLGAVSELRRVHNRFFSSNKFLKGWHIYKALEDPDPRWNR